MEEYIDFEKIRSTLKIDKGLFAIYLKEIYKDLSDRDSEFKKSGITKITFYDYIKIQIFIAEKLFQTMDKDNDGFLNFKDFSEGMTSLYISNFEESSKFIYELYDFDRDGVINAGDVKMILSHLPLKNTNSNSEYNHQLESLNEIDDILNKTFVVTQSLTYTEFTKIIESKNSDIYFQLLFFLFEKKPFTDYNINVYKNSPKKMKFENLDNISPANKSKPLLSPSKRFFLSPADNFLKKIKQK